MPYPTPFPMACPTTHLTACPTACSQEAPQAAYSPQDLEAARSGTTARLSQTAARRAAMGEFRRCRRHLSGAEALVGEEALGGVETLAGRMSGGSRSAGAVAADAGPWCAATLLLTHAICLSKLNICQGIAEHHTRRCLFATSVHATMVLCIRQSQRCLTPRIMREGHRQRRLQADAGFPSGARPGAVETLLPTQSTFIPLSPALRDASSARAACPGG